MQTNYAHIEYRSGFLTEEFIMDLAVRKSGMTKEQIIELVGIYSRGKRKGLPRGRLTWCKVIRGGWRKAGPGYMNGYVVRPNQTFEYEIKEAWTDKVLWSGR